MAKLPFVRILLVLLAVAASAACGTQAPSTDDQARAIEREVWSPYCPGRLLIDCTTEQARQLRAEIEGRLGRGQSSDEVLRWIRRNHGEEALARPEARGLGLAAWLVPLGVFAIGAVALAIVVRRWLRKPAPAHDG